MLIALGGEDWPALTEPARRLAEDIRARRGNGTVEQATAPSVGHYFVPEPGLAAAPRGEEAQRLDAWFAAWFARRLARGA